jgi:hypothetical protein
MLLPDLRDLIGSESAGDPDQRRPEAAMNQSNFSIDETTNENFLCSSHCLKDCENLAALGMSPPTPFDGLADDQLRKPRNGALA